MFVIRKSNSMVCRDPIKWMPISLCFVLIFKLKFALPFVEYPRTVDLSEIQLVCIVNHTCKGRILEHWDSCLLS